MMPGGVMKGMTTTALPLFFTPAMVADSASFSPSAAKPLEVVVSWRKLGVALDELETQAELASDRTQQRALARARWAFEDDVPVCHQRGDHELELASPADDLTRRSFEQLVRQGRQTNLRTPRMFLPAFMSA
jgi:hypothetical protein